MATGRIRQSVVLPEYVAENLGAPFKVILVNSVEQITNETGAVEQIKIPNLRGLLKQIAATRVLVNRKLSGKDIKFIRKALPVKASTLAEKIGVTPEHFSRCESGDRALSSGTEKCLRIAILLELFKLPDCVGEVCEQNEMLKRKVDAYTKAMSRICSIINSMKIPAAHDPSEALCLSFTVERQESLFNEDDADWTDNQSLLSDAA